LVPIDTILNGSDNKNTLVEKKVIIKPEEHSEEVLEEVKLDILPTDEVPSSYPTQLFNQDILNSRSERLLTYKPLKEDKDLQLLAESLSNNNLYYGDNSDPNYLIEFKNKVELGQNFEEHYE